MNFNALIATLVVKQIITQDEGEDLLRYLNDKPQSTILRDAVTDISEFIGKPKERLDIMQSAKITPVVKPSEETAKK